MVVFPNCKINLGLQIVSKRQDGYHNLSTVFYPIPLCDALEMVVADTFSFTSSGLPINGTNADNLCVKAYNLLKKQFPHLPPVAMHLHKVIPMGAGLGGGSSNGAYTLSLLNTKFSLGLTDEQLIELALQLGSDCPFFIVNKPCFATGRGEIMEPCQVDLSNYVFVLVNPKVHVSTAWAFSQIVPQNSTFHIKEVVEQPIQTWKNVLTNHFESAVIHSNPEIGVIKETLYNQGAIYASMTGSGSTVFGIFSPETQISLSFPNHYFVHTTQAKNQF